MCSMVTKSANVLYCANRLNPSRAIVIQRKKKRVNSGGGSTICDFEGREGWKEKDEDKRKAGCVNLF